MTPQNVTMCSYSKVQSSRGSSGPDPSVLFCASQAAVSPFKKSQQSRNLCTVPKKSKCRHVSWHVSGKYRMNQKTNTQLNTCTTMKITDS